MMDAQSAISLAKNPTHHKRKKHIDIKYHWLREHTCEDGDVNLVHCATGNMDADGPLPFDPAVTDVNIMTGNGDLR